MFGRTNRSTGSIFPSIELFSTGRTAEKNHYMVEAVDEYNEEHILQLLFHQANVTSISDYGPVGDPRVSEAEEMKR